MTTEPLVAALLELDAELRGSIPLCIGGGLGLYLKQIYLQSHPEIRTLFPLDSMPQARTTQDIDVFLQAEIVTDSERVRPLRDALDHLGYEAVDSAKFMQFVKPWPPGTVKVDLLAGPLGSFASRVPTDDRRIKPQPSVNRASTCMHGRLTQRLALRSIPLKSPYPGCCQPTRFTRPLFSCRRRSLSCS